MNKPSHEHYGTTFADTLAHSWPKIPGAEDIA